MMKAFLYRLCLLPLLLSVTTASAWSYTNLISFGDSLSDVGNNTWDPHHVAEQKGAPITNINANGERALWLNDLALEANLADGLVHHSTEKGLDLSRQNVDFAWAGAESGNHLNNDMNVGTLHPACTRIGFYGTYSCVPGLLQQVNSYLKITNNHPSKTALYTLWSGGNDIFDSITLLISGMKDRSKLPQYLKEMGTIPSAHLANAAKLLMKNGVPGNHILVFNLPDLSQTPAAQQMVAPMPEKERKLFLGLVHDVVDGIHIKRIDNLPLMPGYNQYLSGRLHLLGKHHPILVDAYTLFDNIMHQKSGAPHFDHLFQSCIAGKALDKHCQGYVFYNSKHPTTETGEVIAQLVLQQLNQQR